MKSRMGHLLTIILAYFLILILTGCFEEESGSVSSEGVFVENFSGKHSDGYFWEIDPVSSTLTIKVPGMFSSAIDAELLQTGAQYFVEHILLQGKSVTLYDLDQYGYKDVTMIAGSGFSWKVDLDTRTAIMSGPGNWTNGAHFPTALREYYDTLVISDGVEAFGRPNGVISTPTILEADTMVIGKDAYPSDGAGIPYLSVEKEYIVSPDNPYLAAYDGALYTKDLQTLISCPGEKTDIDFPPELRVIGERAFGNTSINELVIPWGVEVLEEDSLCQYGDESSEPYIVVLPDTVREVGKWFGGGRDGQVLYSRNITALEAVRKETKDMTDSFFGFQVGIEVDSVAEYYPERSK